MRLLLVSLILVGAIALLTAAPTSPSLQIIPDPAVFSPLSRLHCRTVIVEWRDQQSGASPLAVALFEALCGALLAELAHGARNNRHKRGSHR